MSREIKFRAWDKVDNVMRVVTEINFRTGCIDVEPIEGSRECWELYDPVLFKGQYELMEYTGLKDKNGVEVYKGDIFKAPHDYGPAGFDKSKGIVHFDVRNGYQWEYWLIEDLEVIGNIYENPELLKEDN